MHVVLVEPEIAGNSGNIIRLCANTGVQLHLVEPLGYSMESSLLKRAGLDYHDMASVRVHADLAACLAELDVLGTGTRYALRSQATQRYDQLTYAENSVFIFGAESAGLSPQQREALQPTVDLRLPMRPENRSLNLANSVAIMVFEAWRQQGFAGSADTLSPVAGQGQTAEAFTAEPYDP